MTSDALNRFLHAVVRVFSPLRSKVCNSLIESISEATSFLSAVGVLPILFYN